MQVRTTGNEEAVECYEHMGGREVARAVDGIMVGEGGWREPSRGNKMMRFDGAPLDCYLGLAGQGANDAPNGPPHDSALKIITADSLGELREMDGMLDKVREAALSVTRTQAWRANSGVMPCLRDGGDGMGCRYVVIVREEPIVASGPDMHATSPGREDTIGRICTTVTRRETLHVGTEHDTSTMGIKEIYESLLAAKWNMPAAFQPQKQGQEIWEQKGREGGDSRREDIAKVYEGITHPAVPIHMSDRAYKVATGTEFTGRKFLGDKGGCARCGCVDETTLHRYARCPEVCKLWGLVCGAWHRISGGERLDPGDDWIKMWGARWATWKDPQEKEDYGSEEVEEVFQVIHKATLQAIHEDAMQRNRMTQGLARHMYQRVQNLVRKIISDRRTTATKERFARTWVRPGYVVTEEQGTDCLGVRMWEPGFKKGEKGERATGRRREEAARTAREATEAEAMVARGAVELYTDGSGQGEEAGWGWVAVVSGEEVAAGRGPVITAENGVGWRGAEVATNNTGELTAILEALGWATSKRQPRAVIRYDSTYAANMTQGRWKPKRNKKLIRQCQEALDRAERQGCTVGWRHVKGHSGDRWNDRADRLADQGLHAPPGGEAVIQGQDEPRPGQRNSATAAQGPRPIFRAKGGPAGPRVEPEAREGEEVRWVTYVQTSTGRIEKATTGFGTLNMPTPKQPVPPPELATRARLLVGKVRQEQIRGEVSKDRADAAVYKLRTWAAVLAQAGSQRREITAARKPKVVCSLDCDINIEALETYAAARQGEQGGERRWKQVETVLAKAKALGPTRARLRIDYAYSPMGRALVEAGHVTCSRVYAIGVDPFKGWDKHLRKAAFHDTGWECDDAAAFPNARVAMVPNGDDTTRMFLVHREEIFAKVGETLFPEEMCRGNRRDWVKKIFAGYDNDATMEGWAKTTSGCPRGRTIKGIQITVGQDGGAGTVFRPEDYWRAQQQSSAWMWEHAGEELRDFVQERNPTMSMRGRRLTWKSYVLQEAEAVSRGAKIKWARKKGVTVHSLQHDCVVLGKIGQTAMDQGESEYIARELSTVATAAAGYPVDVKAEWMEELGAVRWVD